ncbi:unnamed protein product [Ambrosiozyma monospora]|uniref:Unnamed protein product n=1 Tax=Ambrosiozyma monospora TaxID=43982 RepID=A0ACB5T9P0_AMBMO|nr:unnamed protein product [Ambrosiozyma monospora]
MTNNFKTSVVRHTNNAGMAKNKLRNQLSRQELSDIFQNLDVRDREGYLSTVQEQDDDYDSDVDEDYRNKVVTLTKENVDLFNETADDFEDQLNPNSPLSNPKMMMLAKYMESNDEFDEFDQDDFSGKVKSLKESKNNFKQQHKQPQQPSRKGKGTKYINMPLPIAKDTLVPGQINTLRNRSDSLHSMSSVSSHPTTSKSGVSNSNYTESETDHSDYADDFEELEDKVDLIAQFKKQQQQAKIRAEKDKKAREENFSTIQKSIRTSRDPATFLERDHSAMMDDFDEFDNLDTKKLFRFKVLDPERKKGLSKKTSMPLLRKNHSLGTGLNGSPRKPLRRYSSNLDLHSHKREASNPFIDPIGLNAGSKQQRYYYNEDDLDEIEDLPTDDLTITLSDYKKLKRKTSNAWYQQ